LIAAAALGIVVVSALWWLYFDVAAIFARGRLMRARGNELHRLALNSYSYFHLPMFAGIVLFAFGLETTLRHVGEELDTVSAVGLCGGAGLLPARTHRIPLTNDRTPLPSTDCRGDRVLALIPAAVAIPALAALALVSAVCSLVVGYEVLRYREARPRVRHPELAA
jgi:low temperature requirement protein LtrA